MHRSNLAIFPSTLVAAAALLVGCDLEPPGAPDEPEAPAIELLEVRGDGGACFSMDDAGAVECFQDETEADGAILASLPEDDAGPGIQALAPSCVVPFLNDSGWTDHLRVENQCSYLVRVKVVLAFETDLACRAIGPGGHINYSWGYPGRFDKLVSC